MPNIPPIEIVTIITIVKDHASGLHKTYQSLAKQEFELWKMLIIVAPSSDKTLELAKNIEKDDLRVTVFDQIGLGIYEAMNQGILSAKGKYLWFMNAGDQFADTKVLNLAIDAIENFKADLVIGGYSTSNVLNQTIYSYKQKNISSTSFAFNRRFGCHQSMIFKSETIRNVGAYDLKYRLAADYKTTLKIAEAGKVLRVSDVYSIVEPGGISDRNLDIVHIEKHKIRLEIFENPLIKIYSKFWLIAARLKINLNERKNSKGS